LLLPAGCFHDWWDNVTSRDLTWKERMWPKKEDPLEVIKSSSDGAKRAKAFAALREPKDPETRELFIKILSTTAIKDREPMCRMGAIKALGHFHDPRIVSILENAYYGRDPDDPRKLPTLTFTAEFNANIRKEALIALDATSDPEARHLLIFVAKQPRSEGSSVERQQILDERLLAVNALAKFKQYDAVETLYYVLEKNENQALFYRAHEALQASTGKHLPPDPKVWKDVLEGRDAVAHNPNWFERTFAIGKSQPKETPAPEQRLPDPRPVADEAPKPGFFTRLTSWTKKDEPTPTPPNP
jgi:HEAT repeat protein